MSYVRRLIGPVVVLVVLCILPSLTTVTIPGIFDSPLGAPGTMQILTIALIYASLAMTFDLMFGYTGMMSFGHTMWFAMGAYFPAVIMTQKGMSIVPAVVLSAVAVAILSALIGAIALRTFGIAFAMVTLAFAQAFYVFVHSNPTGKFGGDEGVRFPIDKVPDAFATVVDIKNIYWVALALLVVTYLCLRQATGSRAGRVWQALRENPLRVEMVGLRSYPFRLVSFVLAAVLASLCGSVYLLVSKSAQQGIADSDFALLILVMVVLGGSGSLWGAALGGFVYAIASLRLGAVSTSGLAHSSVPHWITGPLTQPQFYVGVGVVLLVVFAPQGLAGLISSIGNLFRRAK